MDDLGDLGGFELINIKEKAVTRTQLEEMRSLYDGEYSDFFSKRAMKYRAMNLHKKEMTEEEMAELIITEYTFLKRPVIQIGNKIYIGNSMKIVEAAKKDKMQMV